MNWQIGYEWVPKRIIGIGAFYSGYAGSGKELIYGSTAKNTLLTNYIAPQAIARFCFGSSMGEASGNRATFSLSASAGLGLGTESQFIRNNGYGCSRNQSKAGVGWNLSVRGELFLTKGIGLYAMLCYIDSYMSRPNDDPYYIKERIIGDWDMYSVSAGIMYCF